LAGFHFIAFSFQLSAFTPPFSLIDAFAFIFIIFHFDYYFFILRILRHFSFSLIGYADFSYFFAFISFMPYFDDIAFADW
jgi:hypothetical protein